MNSSSYKHACPDCKSRVLVRTSEGLSELVRVAYIRCENLSCGATFRATMEITHRISPPTVPNPAIRLPESDWAIRKSASKGKDTDQMDFDDLLNVNTQ